MKVESNFRKLIISSVIYTIIYFIIVTDYHTDTSLPFYFAPVWLTFWLVYVSTIVGSFLSAFLGSYLGIKLFNNMEKVKTTAYIVYVIMLLTLVPLLVFYGQQIDLPIHAYIVLNGLHM